MTYAVTLELFVDGAWLDVTRLDDETYVLESVTIERGRDDAQGRVAPTTVSVTYRDDSATLDWDNPLSPYWHKIGQGTPLRVKVDGEVRATTTLANLQQNPNDDPETLTTSIGGQGLMAGLGDDEKPLESALTRYFNSVTPWQRWALETGPGVQVTEIASSLTGGRPLVASPASAGSTNARVSGVVSGNQTVGPPGAAGAVDVSGGGQLSATFPSPGPTLGPDYLLVEGAFQFAQPVDNVSGSGSVVRLILGEDVIINLFGGPASLLGALIVGDISSDSGEFISLTSNAMVIDDGAWHWARIILFRDTSVSFDYFIYVDDTLVFSGTTVSSALLEPNELTLSGTGELGAVSHWAIWVDGLVGSFVPDDADAGYTAFTGHAGESPADRFLRLGGELGLTATVIGPDAGVPAMGPQASQAKPQELLEETGRVNGGVVYEDRDDELGLVLRTRAGLHNQVATAALTYSHLSRITPVHRNENLSNDVTASSLDGSSARYVIPDGDVFHWSTEQPPDGAGVRERSDSWNADADSLEEIAAWAAHLDSWRAKQFTDVTLELARPTFDAGDRAAVRALDIGLVLTLDTTTAPAYVPYNELRLMVQGYTETASRFLHTFVFKTTLSDLYEVAQVDSGPTSLLANVIDDNDTSIKIQPGSGRAWSDSSTDLPYHIQVNGQPMTVTAITTDTPAFIAGNNGTSGDNASVTPALPAGMTVDVGQLLLVLAAIRNSGTGTVDLHPDYTSIVDFGNMRLMGRYYRTGDFGNMRLMGRYYRTGDAAPVITFTGGVAGASTSALTLGFSGLSMALASGTKQTPAAVTQLNGSAQDIAYPAMTLPALRTGAELLLGWKQDDNTSTGIPAGYSNGQSVTTTTGNDQSLFAHYDLTAATHALGTVTMGGGAAAISRAINLVLRPLQTATVTRGIAGVAVAANPGAEIHGWRMGVNGL